MRETLRTPLGRVRGHGSAKSGTQHFIAQRVTAIALAVLAPWFVISATSGLRFGHDAAVGWVADPLVAAPLILFVIAAFYHMRLGLAVVVEDYIANHGTKALLLILNAFVSIALTVVSVFAILQISFGS